MSSVLRPVGPLEPRVYWVRRAVVIVIVIVVIIVLVEALSGGSGKPAATHSPPGTHPTTSPSSTSTPQVSACDPTTLKLVLSTDTDTYTSGQAPTLSGVFSNTSSSTCTLADAPSQEIWTVKSGTATIWTSKNCTSSDLVKQIRIRAGATKMLHTFWNGHLQTSGCGEGAVAQPGEYTLHATLDGVKGKIAVFHITG